MLSLLGLTPHLSAESFEDVPADVAEVEALFRTDGLRTRLDDRAFYRSIGNLFVVVEPHGEADLPCQREVGSGRYRFVVAPLDLSGGAVPVHACHLIGPGLADRLPRIVSAFRVEPIGTAPDMEPLRLPSGATVDLTTGDYGQALIEDRQKAEASGDPLVRDHGVALAKSFAVSGGWGVFARVDRQRPTPVESVRTGQDGKERRVRTYPRTETVLAYGMSGEELSIETERPDVPGPFTLWHVAAAIPAACTAEIALTRHDIEARCRGTVAVVATDSVAVPVSVGGCQSSPDVTLCFTQTVVRRGRSSATHSTSRRSASWQASTSSSSAAEREAGSASFAPRTPASGTITSTRPARVPGSTTAAWLGRPGCRRLSSQTSAHEATRRLCGSRPTSPSGPSTRPFVLGERRPWRICVACSASWATQASSRSLAM
jgi:hypothetical protein